MKNKLNLVAAVGALAVCLLAAILLRHAGAASALDAPRTITLSALPGGKTTTVDVGRKNGGHGIGDYTITTNAPLRDPASRRTTAHLNAIETVLGRSASGFHVTARLRDGTLDVDGILNPRRSANLLAVTGGTGAYSNARGALRLRVNQRTGHATLTFELLP